MKDYQQHLDRCEQRRQLLEYLAMCFNDGHWHTTDEMAAELAEDAPEGLTPEIWTPAAIGHTIGRQGGRVAGWKKTIADNCARYKYGD